MPIRMLRDWTDSEKVKNLSVHAERFFTRLIMKVDDYGTFHANTALLKANCFPLLLDAIREADISRWLVECQEAGLIVLYEAEGKRYLQICDFGQRLDKARAKFPLPNNQEESQIGYVYLFGTSDSNVFKIGYSLNPWARLKEVVRSKETIDLLGDRSKNLSSVVTLKGSMDEEQALHKLLRNFKIKAEWFHLPKTLIDLFTSFYEDGKLCKDIIVEISSKTVGNYVPAETENETENEKKPKRAKALVITSDDGSSKAMRHEYDLLVKSLEGKERIEVWTNLRQFIQDKKPTFINPYMDLWNVFAISKKIIQQQQSVTEKRKKKFSLRIAEPGFDFLKILEKISNSAFLKGVNSNNWKVSIEFILESEENYTKILEGKYD